jgi:hypothetical protein
MPHLGEDAFEAWQFYAEGFQRFLDDCVGSRSGLSTVRVYRPVPSLAFYLQTRVSYDPTWLRLANLVAYGLGAAATCLLAKRWTSSTVSALFAGLWVVAFRGGIGNWCWIVGRVDAFSFGFGMLGFYLYLFPGERRPVLMRAIACAFLVLAFLSKETAVVFAPALVIFLGWMHGLRGIVDAIVPSFLLSLVFLARFYALDGILGGYLGQPRGVALETLTPDAAGRVASIAFGVPRPWALAVLTGTGLAVAAGAAVAFKGRRTHRNLTSAGPAVAALLVAILAYVPPTMPHVGEGDLQPQTARAYPIAFAFLGLALAWGLTEAIRLAWLRWILAGALLALPAQALLTDLGVARDAARVVESCEARVRASCEKAPPSSLPVLAADLPTGWPPRWPVVPIFNHGVPQRFEPPLDTATRRRVWALRLLLVEANAPKLNLTQGSVLAGLVSVDPAIEPNAALAFWPREGAPALVAAPRLPASLTGADANAMKDGALDIPIEWPDVQGAARLQVAVVTPVAFGIAVLDSVRPSWKQLLTARLASGEGLVYQLPGLAADYGAASFLLRFEWLDSAGARLAETDPVEVKTDRDFERFVRAEADAIFGTRAVTR